MLLPKRWVVERGFAWAAQFRHLTCDCERLATTLAGLRFLACASWPALPGLRFLAFACLMLYRFIVLI
jgi:DDE family transposase